MSERIRSFFTYIIVLFILLAALAIISPTQFQNVVDLFSGISDLFLVLLVIAIFVLFLKKIERI